MGCLTVTWTLEISRCSKGEDEILGILAASITPREEADKILIEIEPRQTTSMPSLTFIHGEVLLVVSFDGSARIKIKVGPYSTVIWKLPEWTILSSSSRFGTG